MQTPSPSSKPIKTLVRINKLISRPGKPGLLPVSSATLWRWVRAGNFPAPIRLGESTTVWDLSQVEDWLTEQAAKPFTVDTRIERISATRRHAAGKATAA